MTCSLVLHLEKAFDRVSREVLWWALRRRVGVDGWIMNAIKALHADATAAVKLNGASKQVPLTVGVRQGSVLNPLLFNIVLEALSKEFKVGLPWELLYADDLVLLAELAEELLEKIKCWKEGLEEKGLRVNMGKTKVMKCCIDSSKAENSGKWHCSVCSKSVGRNSIMCASCKK